LQWTKKGAVFLVEAVAVSAEVISESGKNLELAWCHENSINGKRKVENGKLKTENDFLTKSTEFTERFLLLENHS